MPICFSFIGWHNAGKTTIAEKVVRVLVQKGFDVGVIKSTKHMSLAHNPKKSDSYRLQKAGASSVALACPDQLIIFNRNMGYTLEYLAFRLFPDADIVIGEGFKNDPEAIKIEVARKDVSDELLADKVPNVVGIVADFDPGRENCFHVEDIDGLVKFIEQRFLDSKDTHPKVEMYGDGKKIYLKYFVRKTLKGLLFGFASSLRGTESIERLEVMAKRKSPRP